jgi:molecular chaperone GrpE
MPKKTKEKETNKKLKEKDEKINELTESLQRLQAEFENYKKRTELNNAEYRKCAIHDFIKKLLPVIDNFELALQHKKNKEEFLKGVELIYSELYSILEDEGLEKIDALNKKFDPYFHEALLSEKSDKPNVVLEELQKGYKLKDKVLRHTKVKVSK